MVSAARVRIGEAQDAEVTADAPDHGRERVMPTISAYCATMRRGMCIYVAATIRASSS